jgi:hypothetical protein
LEGEVFTYGVAYLFLGKTHFDLGQAATSIKFLQRAKQVIEKQRRQFLIPGVGTYIFHGIYMSSGSAAPGGAHTLGLTTWRWLEAW